MDTSNIVIKKAKSDVSKTQKKKTTLSIAEKEKLWAVFDVVGRSEIAGLKTLLLSKKLLH